MACVDPRDIPQSFLPPGPSRKKEMEAIRTLTAYSFISRRPADLGLDIHQLVHLAIRNWLRNEGLFDKLNGIVIVRLEEVFPGNDYTNRGVWRSYLPHVRYIVASDVFYEDGEKRLSLMLRYGMCLYSDGRWNEAEESFAHVLETAEKKMGADHPYTLTIMANLVSTYMEQGR